MKEVDFDLEECFTFLELQRLEAETFGDENELANSTKLVWQLIRLLLELMSEFNDWYIQCNQFRSFATRVWNERATVLTFNYDTLMESALESVSPRRAGKQEMAALFRINRDDETVTEDQIGYSPNEWNPQAAYGVSFDEVSLRLPGNTRMVDGARYFNHPRNKITSPLFLKLHGSLGWFVRSGYRVDGVKLEGDAASHAKRSVLRRSYFWPPLDVENEIAEVLLPLIITPILNKPYNQQRVFRQIWDQARIELGECRRLVIGGYSFPPADFHVRCLLRKTFSERCELEELHIINPDSSILRIAKELCNYRRPVTISGSIAEFLDKS